MDIFHLDIFLMEIKGVVFHLPITITCLLEISDRLVLVFPMAHRFKSLLIDHLGNALARYHIVQ